MTEAANLAASLSKSGMGRYQYKREPLSAEEANRLANGCETHLERLVIYTFLDTGVRVSELAGLKRSQLDWQNHRVTIYGKGGPFGSHSKRRVLPLSRRVQALLEGHFAVHETLGVSVRSLSRLVKRIAVRAGIMRPTSPHVLRHTLPSRRSRRGSRSRPSSASSGTITWRRPPRIRNVPPSSNFCTRWFPVSATKTMPLPSTATA